jgi:hypothetical protein
VVRRADDTGTFRRSKTRASPRAAAAAAALALVAAAARPAAHEIPRDITVQAFIKPEGQRLRMLVRVPLGAMRDVDIPVRPNGALDLSRIDPVIRQAALVWLRDAVALYEEDERREPPVLVAARVALPSDRAFSTYETALAAMTGARAPLDTDVTWSQALLDVLFEYRIRSETARFSIEPGFARLAERVLTVVRFLPPGGAVRAFEFAGDPGLVRLDPRWHQAALTFVRLGFLHILDGTDHLLFLLCLVVPIRRVRPLVAVVTSFTVAHSVTLVASAYRIAPDALWFPPLIETLIAASIVYMAIENVTGRTLQGRWLLAFGFGLVHGFGFSFALRQTVQFAGAHLVTSLVSFNLGVELGQLFVLALLVPALELLFRYVLDERMGTLVLSALVGHTGWHWLLERAARLRQFRFEWPTADLALLAGVLRWLMLALIVGAALWALSSVLRQPVRAAPKREPAGAEE